MAIDQHVGWLLAGVETWTNMKNQGLLQYPDLSGEDVSAKFTAAGLDQPNEGVRLPGANLKGIDLELVNLSKSALRFADLSESRMAGANLSDGSFQGSNFAGANLADANLAGANLAGANFTGAKLRMANLSGADLRNTELQDADLSHANMSQTNLNTAKLGGANLVGAVLIDASLQEAELIRSRLFDPLDDWPNHETWKPEDETECVVNSIEELLGTVRDIKNHYKSLQGDVFLYFRGDARCDWDLCPSIVRTLQRPTPPSFWDELPSSPKSNPLRDLDVEELLEFAQFLSDFERWEQKQGADLAPRAFERDMLVELMARRPEEFASMPSALAQWMLAQHHGLQTRFLDVSKSLLVAAHFACSRDPRRDGRVHVFAVPKLLVKPFNSDAISVVANLAKLEQPYQDALLNKIGDSRNPQTTLPVEYGEALRLLYQLIREEKPNFERRIDPRDFYRVFVVEPQQLSERLRAQSGAFLVSAFHENFQREEILAINPDIPVFDYYALTIPSAAKADFLNDLPLMDTTSEKLFPGLDSSAAAVLTEFGLRHPPIPGQR